MIGLAILSAAALLALDDPAEEARARALMGELRCVVCAGETIDTSQTDLAEDMRAQVRRLVADGASDDEVRAWFIARHGEDVVTRPRVTPLTWALWAAPLAFLTAACVFVWRLWRRGPGETGGSSSI